MTFLPAALDDFSAVQKATGAKECSAPFALVIVEVVFPASTVHVCAKWKVVGDADMLIPPSVVKWSIRFYYSCVITVVNRICTGAGPDFPLHAWASSVLMMHHVIISPWFWHG